jgi:hypothetical protein
MVEDQEGRALLKQLRLDGFVAGEYRLFEDIAKMARELG